MSTAARSTSASSTSRAGCVSPARLTIRAGRAKQRGVVAIEFALTFIFGLLPLLLLMVSGTLIFAAKQSLTLAADNGARAALRYSTNRQATACLVAQESMAWLLSFSGETPSCGDGPIVVSTIACPSDAGLTCVQVVTSFDYKAHPFIPGTAAAYGWNFDSISSTAIVQL